MIRRVNRELVYKADATDKARIGRAIDICADVAKFANDANPKHAAVKASAALTSLESLLWPPEGDETEAKQPDKDVKN